ncbi:hypothetical protein ACEY8O_23350, partial [Salmonella enterica subsp. enterica]
MDKKLEPYYLSAETALSIVSKKFNIKIDIKEDDINLRFKKYDRNNTCLLYTYPSPRHDEFNLGCPILFLNIWGGA